MSSGVSMSQRKPAHEPHSSTAPLLRCRPAESTPKAGSRGTPWANSATVPVPCRSLTKLRRCRRAAEIASAKTERRRAGRSPCSTPTWDVPRQTAASAARIALFSGSRCPAGVGSLSTWAPNPAAAVATTSSGVTTVMLSTAETAMASPTTSASIARTSDARVVDDNAGASRVLASPIRFTAMTSANVAPTVTPSSVTVAPGRAGTARPSRVGRTAQPMPCIPTSVQPRSHFLHGVSSS